MTRHFGGSGWQSASIKLSNVTGATTAAPKAHTITMRGEVVVSSGSFTQSVKEWLEARGYYANVVNDRERHSPERILKGARGLVLTGGSDIHPALYGKGINGAIGIDAERDVFEASLLRVAFDAKLPVLGICRGCQMLAVATGGTLYQDILSDLPETLTRTEVKEVASAVTATGGGSGRSGSTDDDLTEWDFTDACAYWDDEEWQSVQDSKGDTIRYIYLGNVPESDDDLRDAEDFPGWWHDDKRQWVYVGYVPSDYPDLADVPIVDIIGEPLAVDLSQRVGDGDGHKGDAVEVAQDGARALEVVGNRADDWESYDWQGLPMAAEYTRVVSLHASGNHPISVQADTGRLARAIGSLATVNSYHHQSIELLPDAWRIAAVAPDGVIEAITHKSRRGVWGVQFHPEVLASAGALWDAWADVLSRGGR